MSRDAASAWLLKFLPVFFLQQVESAISGTGEVGDIRPLMRDVSKDMYSWKTSRSQNCALSPHWPDAPTRAKPARLVDKAGCPAPPKPEHSPVDKSPPAGAAPLDIAIPHTLLPIVFLPICTACRGKNATR